MVANSIALRLSGMFTLVALLIFLLIGGALYQQVDRGLGGGASLRAFRQRVVFRLHSPDLLLYVGDEVLQPPAHVSERNLATEVGFARARLSDASRFQSFFRGSESTSRRVVGSVAIGSPPSRGFPLALPFPTACSRGSGSSKVSAASISHNHHGIWLLNWWG